MSQDKQFKQLERMAYLSYQQDGIIDLLVGWATLSYGLNIAMDTSIWTYLGWLPIVFYIPLKTESQFHAWATLNLTPIEEDPVNGSSVS